MSQRSLRSSKKKVNKLKLPKPTHEYGYTVAQIDSFMTEDEQRKFNKWMYGQTMMLDEKLGTIIYTCDVERFLRLVRFGTPTYWD